MLLGWLLAGAVSVADGQTLSAPYSIDTWQTDQGLPQNSVTSLVPTRDGYLWVGTYNGLVRFDGARFVTFNAGNTPALGSSRVTSLFEDAAGSLWIGNETGELTRFDRGKFEHFAPGTNPPAGALVAISETAEHTLCLLNSAGWLFCRQDNGFGRLDGGAPAENTLSLARGADGRVWLVGGNQLRVVSGRQIINPAQAPKPDYYTERACASRDGGLWLVGGGSLRKLSPAGAATDLGPAPWGNDSLTTLLETSRGELLVGTLADGIYVRAPDGEIWHCQRRNGLAHDWVRSLAEDGEGTVWVGTGGGLNALRPRRIQMVSVPDDWEGRAILSVSPRRAGGLWVATEGAGLYEVFGETTRRYVGSNGLANLFVWSVLEDHRQNLWVGTWGGGLFTRTGDRLQQAPGMAESTVPMPALYEARGGVLWLGTQMGLARYENGQCQWYTRSNGLALPDVRTIVEDDAGTIWFGMAGGGLGRWQGGQIRQFRKADGLPSDFVWSLLAEPGGTLWIGTFGGGLARLQAGRFTTLAARQGLPNNVICHLEDDGLGYFWLSSDGGIFRVAKSELRQCADGLIPTVNCLTYGRADGLNTLECSGGSQPSGGKTPDGRLWFPTSKGLAVIDPANVKINPRPPPVVIEEILADDEPVPGVSTGRVVIPPGKQRFEFRYTGLSLIAPAKVRFKYRLDNLESDWESVGPRRVANYSFLRPGEYHFRVTACNSDGTWNETGAAVTLVLQPFFWQTWWFISGATLGAMGAVGGAARFVTRRRYRQRMERLERQRAIERERARIARDIHDDLGASLTRITMLSHSRRAEMETPEQAAADLDQIYRTARQLTRAMDEIVWAVSPQHDSLDSLVAYLGKFAQDFLSVASIRCRLHVPLTLPAWALTAEVRHNLFLAVKEALHNVLKHAAATEVRVSLELAPTGFTLTVSDNGRGFDPAGAAATASPADRPSPGRGLENMRQRLAEIGGQCVIRSTPGEGTQIRYVMPVSP